MPTAIEFLTQYYYKPFDELERLDIKCLRDYAMQIPTDEIYKNIPGRPAIVASAVIVNPNFTRILVMHHRLHGFYKQLGGHADGDKNLLNVAMREASEEAGISAYPMSREPFDFVIWTMGARTKNNIFYPQHNVMDVAFLFCCHDNAKLKLQKKEGLDLKWISLDEWRDMKFDPNNETIKLNPQNSIYNPRITRKIEINRHALQHSTLINAH